MSEQSNPSLKTGDFPRLVCARTIEEINKLRPLWEQMQRHPNTDIDFYLTIIGSRPQIERPHVILVERQGHPRLLVIGRIEQRPLALPLGYKVLNGPRMRLLMVLYGGILGEGSPEDERLVIRHFQQMLESGEIDLVFFNHLGVGSSFYNLATTLPPRICRANHLPANPHHRLALTGSYEDYLNTLSKNTRKNLRRYGRRLEKDWGHAMRVQSYTSPQDLETVLRDAETIARKTYQRGLGVGFIANDEMRQRIRLELERGWLRAWFLYLDQRPVAFSFINHYREVAYANETGYDPEFGEYRIGHHLNECIIEQLCADPAITALDYGFGDAEYKRAICNEVWNEVPVYIFSPTLRGLSLHVLQASFNTMESLGRGFVEKIRLLPVVKRLWRRSVVPCAPAG